MIDMVRKTSTGTSELPAVSFLSKATDFIVVLLVGGVGGFVIVSLALTLSYHSRGDLAWDKLAEIGEFWGGHLNSIALIFLGMTLLVQRSQFTEDQKTQHAEQDTLRLQVEMLRAERLQQELHFALEQLREESARLSYRSMQVDDLSAQWKPGPIQQGLMGLAAAWREEVSSDDSFYVVTCQRDIEQYLQISAKAQAAMDSLQDPPDAPIQVCRDILSGLAPQWMNDLISDRIRRRTETVVFFAHNGEDVSEWTTQIEYGWRLGTSQIVAGIPALILIRDDLHSPRRIFCHGTPGGTTADVVRAALAQVEASPTEYVPDVMRYSPAPPGNTVSQMVNH